MNPLINLRTAFEAGDLSKQEYIEAIHNQHRILFNYPGFISDTDVESLHINPEGVFIRSRSQQIELWLDPMDQHLVPCTLMNFRSYELAETEFLKSIANNDWTMIDIGANCGWYSLALARKFPSMTIHACEPIFDTYKILLRNISHNKIKNIHAHQTGFSDKTEKLDFFHTPKCSGATSLLHAGQPVNDTRDLQKITCSCVPLDEFCSKNKITPHLIKCDVEGAELLVIQGGKHTLKSCKPVILCELLRKWSKKFGYHPNDVINLLKKYGYKAYTIHQKNITECPYIDEETIETNFFFLHPEQHREIIPQ